MKVTGNWSEIESIQRGSKDKIRVHSGIWWIHKAASRTFHAQIAWRSHCRQGNQFNQPLQFGTKICSCAASHENSGSKSSSGQGMEKARSTFSMAAEKSQEQEGGHKRGTKKTKGKCTLLHWWSRVISKNAELEPKYQKYKGRVVLRGDIIKDDTGAHAFPFPLKFFARSTCTDLDVAQEKRIDDHCNVDENRSLPDSWTGFTKFTLLTHTPLKGFFVFQEETDKKFKQLLDQIIFGLKLGWKLEKPLKKKKNKNGHSRNRNLTMPEIWEDFTSLIQVWWLQRHHQECKTEIGNADGSGDAM